MNEKIGRHVDKLFEGAPNTRRAFELKTELIANLNDRYNDLVAQGTDADAAYAVVIGGIGDVDQLIRELREPDAFDPVQIQMQRQKSAVLISVAVAIFVLSLIPSMLFSEFGRGPVSGAIGNMIMLMFWAAGAMILVYNHMSKPKYQKREDTLVEEFKQFSTEKRKDEAARATIISMIPMLAVILFFILGFGFGLWHPGWMVFLLIPVAIQIVRLVGIYWGED